MHLKFSIKSSTHYLSYLRKLLLNLDLPDGVGLPHDDRARLGLALVEAVNNVIFHAHENNSDKWIDISVNVSKKKFELGVTDYGSGFDIPDDVDIHLEETHGRGLLIIRSVVHDVEYVRSNGSNKLIMTYHI